MEEVAQSLDADTEALLDKWEGRPDLVIEDIFRVRDLDTKEVSDLELTPYQRQFVHAVWYGDESTVNVLKGRRTGYSFIACATILLKMLTTPHGFYAITAPSKSQAKDRIEDIYDLMDWSRLEFNPEIDNRDEVKLSNSATAMAFSGNPDTSRGGDSADILFVDEKDFLADQEESMRAFGPFTALGDATEVNISTPRLKNSLFMEDQKRGSPTGDNGIISIEQSAFENPDSINVDRTLYEQDVEPVMPYLSVDEAEKARARDPTGFNQEYLCNPVEDQYRFFDESTVEAAIERALDESYAFGPSVGPDAGGKTVMAIDISGGGSDDTAISIVEHLGKKRFHRYSEVVTDESLGNCGIEPANARNPSAIAARINQLYQINGVDRVVTDATTIGEGFDSEIRETIGRGVNSFDFRDKEAVAEMMGDLNYGFHNGQIWLRDSEQIKDQLLAIVKDQTRKGSQPHFSGKDHAPNGKDDVAISFALAAYPPNSSTEDKSLKEKEEVDDDDRDLDGLYADSNVVVESESDTAHPVAHSNTAKNYDRRNRNYDRSHGRSRRRS